MAMHNTHCDDYNMVEHTRDSTTQACMMFDVEKNVWHNVVNNLGLEDLSVHCKRIEVGHTYYSSSHSRAWSCLDRMYAMPMSSLPPLCNLNAYVKLHISNHCPLILELLQYDWQVAI